MNDIKKINYRLSNKIKKIKLVVTDVDGVLTDGGMYYSVKGEMLKKFNTKDGMGVELLLKKGIKTVLITKEKSKIVQTRARKIKAIAYLGIKKKEVEINNIKRRFGVKNDEIAYLGDDINDIKIMKKVGFSAMPRDGNYQVKRYSNYICELKGGQGVFREISDLILKIKFP